MNRTNRLMYGAKVKWQLALHCKHWSEHRSESYGISAWTVRERAVCESLSIDSAATELSTEYPCEHLCGVRKHRGRASFPFNVR